MKGIQLKKNTNLKKKVSSPKKTAKKQNKKYTISIYNVWCKICGICIAFCPKNVLGFNDEDKLIATNPDNCIGCGLCELRCPDYAIEINEKKGEKIG